MTQFLASVTGPLEAAIAVEGGADVIDLKDPAQGALGAVAACVVRDTVAAVAGARPVSAVLGDLPMQPAVLRGAAETMADCGVDYVKCGVFPGGDPAACLRALAPLARHVKLVAVLFADRAPDCALLDVAAQAGFAAAMLDTADKRAGRLLAHRDLAALRGFVEACRARGLLTGLAGALEPPDVPRLLVLEPDFLGFRGALCSGGRSGTLDPAAIAGIRALIPRAASGHAPAAVRLLAARAYAPPPSGAGDSDRVFVRDLVLPVRIGAYAAEHAAPQRVRFEVEATVARPPGPQGMADVFSYDIITDGIRLLIAEGHVALLETLAERIAALLLAYRAVSRVLVRLEKLDVHAAEGGVVGCIVERRQPAS
jgi:dihydroneopterin aldolase